MKLCVYLIETILNDFINIQIKGILIDFIKISFPLKKLINFDLQIFSHKFVSGSFNQAFTEFQLNLTSSFWAIPKKLSHAGNANRNLKMNVNL